MEKGYSLKFNQKAWKSTHTILYVYKAIYCLVLSFACSILSCWSKTCLLYFDVHVCRGWEESFHRYVGSFSPHVVFLSSCSSLMTQYAVICTCIRCTHTWLDLFKTLLSSVLTRTVLWLRTARRWRWTHQRARPPWRAVRRVSAWHSTNSPSQRSASSSNHWLRSLTPIFSHAFPPHDQFAV